jgi:hypothetical protein
MSLVIADSCSCSKGIAPIASEPTITVHPFLNVAPTGQHLSPKEFHAVIESYLKEDAGCLPVDDTDEETKRKELVLIDVRNIYETKIGRFQVTSESKDKEVVPVLDPHTRQV